MTTFNEALMRTSFHELLRQHWITNKLKSFRLTYISWLRKSTLRQTKRQFRPQRLLEWWCGSNFFGLKTDINYNRNWFLYVVTTMSTTFLVLKLTIFNIWSSCHYRYIFMFIWSVWLVSVLFSHSFDSLILNI